MHDSHQLNRHHSDKNATRLGRSRLRVSWCFERRKLLLAGQAGLSPACNVSTLPHCVVRIDKHALAARRARQRQSPSNLFLRLRAWPVAWQAAATILQTSLTPISDCNSTSWRAVHDRCAIWAHSCFGLHVRYQGCAKHVSFVVVVQDSCNACADQRPWVR